MQNTSKNVQDNNLDYVEAVKKDNNIRTLQNLKKEDIAILQNVGKTFSKYEFTPKRISQTIQPSATPIVAKGQSQGQERG